jgi:hypothetical protein
MNAFAYSHDGSLNGNGEVVPDYADGADPPGAGHWYFTSNQFGGPFVDFPDEFYQDIDVTAGATGATIASGFAGFNLSAWMSSYLNDDDIARARVEFRTSGGASLGSQTVSDGDPGPANVWSLNTGTGVVPIGTATVRLSIWGHPFDGGPDGYIDNVDFRISEVDLPALRITVNRDTGAITMSNDTGGSVNLSGYSITSEFEGLAPANWLSIAENYDNLNPGPNQVDAAHAWSELTDANVHTDLSEADLQAGTGATLTDGKTINLSNASAWIRTFTEDLVFRYVSNGQVVDGIVSYIGNGNNPFDFGDLNTNGVINSADWAVFRANQHGDLSALSLAEAYRAGDMNGDKLNNFDDFIAFKAAYDSANGAGSFAMMLSSIPEPSSILLVLASGLFMVPLWRRSPNRP